MKKISLLLSVALMSVICMLAFSAYAQEVKVIDNSNTVVTVSPQQSVYTGSAIKPAVTVKYEDTALAVGTDYTVAYKNNVSAGTATVVVTGTGDYSGSCSESFTITPKTSTASMTFKQQYTTTVYDGKAKTPTVTVKDGSTTLVKNKDYTVTYGSNKNIGQARIYINGVGNYSFSKTLTFNIKPCALSGVSVTNDAESVTFSWDKLNNVTGYQIVSYDASAKAYKSVKYIASANTTSYTITGLKPNSEYTYNVRAYVNIDGSNYYGAYVDNIIVKTDAKPTYIKYLYKDGTDISVKWSKVDCAGYEIRYSTKSDFQNAKSVYAAATATSYTIKNRGEKLNYYVQVTPYVIDDGAKRLCERSAAICTTSSPTFKALENPVTGLKFKNATDSITLSWKKMSNVTGYQVLLYNASTKKYSSVKYITSPGTTSYTVKGLKPNTQYTYCVRAYAKIGGKNYYGAYSSNLATKTRALSTQITYIVKNGKNITVKWDKVSCSGYQIRYSTKANMQNAKIIYVTGGSTSSYVITNRNEKLNYYVQVTPYVAFNGAKYFSTRSLALNTAYAKKLVSYSSNYVNNPNRTNNLILAAKAIDGTVVMPGETFSFNQVVGQRTYAKGYKDAPVFVGGNSVQNGVGGGICQVASTMFNTALLSNVQIVERHQHSQRVTYVPLGRDAAISWGSQDFKWKNNTNYPIKIEVKVSNGTITCSFYTSAAVSSPDVKLSVANSGNSYTLRRTVNGKCNYTTYSKY